MTINNLQDADFNAAKETFKKIANDGISLFAESHRDEFISRMVKNGFDKYEAAGLYPAVLRSIS